MFPTSKQSNSVEALAKAKMERHLARLPTLDLPPVLEAHVTDLIRNWQGWQRLVILEQEKERCKVKSCTE